MVLGLQAIVLSFLLASKRPTQQVNSLLALILFFFALMAVNIALVNVLLTYDVFYIFRYVQLELLFGIGPAIYFYSRCITDKAYRFSKKDYLHFIPLMFEFVFYRTPFYRLGADGLYLPTPHPYTKIYLMEQWLGILSISVYILLSIRILVIHHKKLKSSSMSLKYKSLKWLQLPVVIYSGFWIGWNILTEVDRFVYDGSLKESYFLPTFTGLAAITCWLGFTGYTKNPMVAEPPNAPKLVPKVANPALAQKVTQIMQEKRPYLDPELDLSKLAELLSENPKLVSKVINQDFSMNFYEFINRHRVDHFKQRLRQPEHHRMTLLAHAYESGFKSKSTFNHVFKKMTGLTPSQYYSSCKKESECVRSDDN